MFHLLVLESVRGIARHDVPAPEHLAGLGVVCGDVAALTELRSRLADEHAAVRHARRAGDRIRFLRIRGLLRPHLLAAACVHGDESPIDGAEVHLAVPRCDTAVHYIAARIHAPLARHLRIELPQFLARLRVVRVELAPRGGDIERAVDDDGRGLLPAARIEVAEPREPQLRDILRRDLLQRAEALLVVIAARGHPLARVLIRSGHPRGIHVGESGRRRLGRHRSFFAARLATRGEHERRSAR